jgi:glutathione S-transferase
MAELDQPGKAAMQIVLYYAPIACSLVPYVSLTEAGAKFEVRPINLRTSQQMSADYLKLNPKHKVPLLIVDGRKLTENTAINTWIHRTFPAARLLPSDPWQELEAISLMSWCASGVHPFLTRHNNPAKVCETPGSEASVRTNATAGLLDALSYAEQRLAGREYFFDHFTAPDAHFYWAMRRAGQFGIDLASVPNCLAHRARIEVRPSVQKLLAFEKGVLGDFAKAA